MVCKSEIILDDCQPYVSKSSLINAINEICSELEENDCIVTLPTSVAPEDFVTAGWGGTLPDTAACPVLTVVYEDGSDVYKAYNNGVDTVFYSTKKQSFINFSGSRRNLNSHLTPLTSAQISGYVTSLEFAPVFDNDLFYSWDKLKIPEDGVYLLGYNTGVSSVVFSTGFSYLILGIHVNGVLQLEEKYTLLRNFYSVQPTTFFSIYFETLLNLNEGDEIEIRLDQIAHPTTPTSVITSMNITTFGGLNMKRLVWAMRV